MSQRVPNCHSDDVPAAVKAADIPMLDYEVAELTWENGQLGMNGLGPPRVPAAPSKYSSTGAGGTLESIVDQATRFPKPTSDADEVVPWFQRQRSSRGMDALVPDQHSQPTTRVGSCSDGYLHQMGGGGKRARDGSRRVTTMDTYGLTSMDDNSSSGGGKPNCTKTTTATTTTTTFFDDHEYSVSHSRPQMEELEEEEEEEEGGEKTSVSTKRSRAAAIHNQSERKRRDKINQRMKTLQKLVPNSSKTDKASMLDEVIEYLKQLQAQIGMMNRMNMPSMMLPAMAMQQQQQQFQLSLMSNPMGLGLGMGMPGLGLLDLNSMNRVAVAAAATTPNIHANMMPTPFVPMTSPTWDASATSNDTRFQSPHLVPADPMATFLACSSQPTTMEAYSRMAALYQQMQQQLPPSNPK